MTLKPLQSLDEHDTINFFALNVATGAKGTPVVISQGWNNSQNLVISATPLVGNNAQSFTNFVAPRWEVAARVRAAVAGERPFGVQLYDVLESNQFNYPLVYDEQRRIERQAVVSGMPVPLSRKGIVLVGPFVTGAGVVSPSAGVFAVVGAPGVWSGVTGAAAGVPPTGSTNPVFGTYLGGLDKDGYAAVSFNCYP